MYERAVAIGEEFRAKGAHVHLGYVYWSRFFFIKAPKLTVDGDQTFDGPAWAPCAWRA
jgi:hypothetical protein